MWLLLLEQSSSQCAVTYVRSLPSPLQLVMERLRDATCCMRDLACCTCGAAPRGMTCCMLSTIAQPTLWYPLRVHMSLWRGPSYITKPAATTVVGPVTVWPVACCQIARQAASARGRAAGIDARSTNNANMLNNSRE